MKIHVQLIDVYWQEDKPFNNTDDNMLPACGAIVFVGVSCELIPFHRLDEILWEKAAVNCFINPLAALLNCLNSQLLDPRLELAKYVPAGTSSCDACPKQ